MTKTNTSSLQVLETYLKKNKTADLLTAYLYWVQHTLHLAPVAYINNKMIYATEAAAVDALEKEGKLWREATITITFGKDRVNDQTTKVFICPHTGHAFGNNTSANPQDEIYDWVARHRPADVSPADPIHFLVSEDPDVIRSYITHERTTRTKTVFSSFVSGKLFDNKKNVLKDFVKNYLKPISLVETQRQNRFEIAPDLLEMLQEQLKEQHIANFIEQLSVVDFFQPHIQRWLEDEEENG